MGVHVQVTSAYSVRHLWPLLLLLLDLFLFLSCFVFDVIGVIVNIIVVGTPCTVDRRAAT